MFGTILVGTVVKSIFIPVALELIRAFHSSKYSNPNCLLRLVNETAPQHYSQHVYYQHLNYDDSCANEELENYVNSQFTPVSKSLVNLPWISNFNSKFATQHHFINSCSNLKIGLFAI